MKYIWEKYKDHEFEKNLSQVYETVVFWRKSLFLLPSGKPEKSLSEKFQD